MLDANFIRKHTDAVRAAIKNKNEKADLDAWLATDEKKRKAQTELEGHLATRNRVSEEVSRLKRDKQDASAQIAQVGEIKLRIKTLEEDVRKLEEELRERSLWLPNCPAADVPVAADAAGNVEVRHWGDRKQFDAKPIPHWDLATKLGILDFPRATKLSGSGFVLWKGLGARLARALLNFMLDLHTEAHGYTEVFPPFLVNRDSMRATGQIPKLENDMYRCDADDLFLIPTAEVPVTNIHRDEVLKAADLPIYYTAYSACFRREAGAAGQDTRGLIRVHQFDKVELVKFVRPEHSYDELETLLGHAEKVLQLLGLEYRVVKLSTGDMSFASAKTYDIEAWAPGVGKWLEVSSCSNFEDFQARRAGIRFRDDDGKVRFVHTLNGSGLALPRTAICLLETYQQADGSVQLPDILLPYMEGRQTLTPAGAGPRPE